MKEGTKGTVALPEPGKVGNYKAEVAAVRDDGLLDVTILSGPFKGQVATVRPESFSSMDGGEEKSGEE